MSCPTCGGPSYVGQVNSAVKNSSSDDPLPKDGPCDVCVNVHSDRSIKPVKFCSTCNAWICNDCDLRYDKRFVAATIAAVKKILSL